MPSNCKICFDSIAWASIFFLRYCFILKFCWNRLLKSRRYLVFVFVTKNCCRVLIRINWKVNLTYPAFLKIHYYSRLHLAPLVGSVYWCGWITIPPFSLLLLFVVMIRFYVSLNAFFHQSITRKSRSILIPWSMNASKNSLILKFLLFHLN